MRKLFLTFLVVGMVFSFSSCNSEDNEYTDQSSPVNSSKSMKVYDADNKISADIKFSGSDENSLNQYANSFDFKLVKLENINIEEQNLLDSENTTDENIKSSNPEDNSSETVNISIDNLPEGYAIDIKAKDSVQTKATVIWLRSLSIKNSLNRVCYVQFCTNTGWYVKHSLNRGWTSNHPRNGVNSWKGGLVW